MFFHEIFFKIAQLLQNLNFGDGVDDFGCSFVAFGTSAAGRRERKECHRQKSNLAAVKSLRFDGAENVRNISCLKFLVPLTGNPFRIGAGLQILPRTLGRARFLISISCRMRPPNRDPARPVG